MDLERTIGFGVPHYWKGNRHGYTTYLEDAGIFSKDFALRVVKSDHDNTTIMLNENLVFKIMGKDANSHEQVN